MALNLTWNANNSTVAALQWTLTYPAADVSAVTVSPGAALTAANKTITCNNVTGSVICVAAGMNGTAIASGIVATVNVTVSATTSSSSLALGLNGVVGAQADGTATAVSGTGGSITLPVAPVATPSSVSVSPSSVSGGSSVAVTVALTGAAPAGGATVLLSGSSPAFPSTSLTVPAGSSSQSATLPIASVSTTTSVTVTASYLGSSVTAALTVNPISTSTQTPLEFVPLTGCRVMDTRANSGTSGSFGPPSIAGGSTRTVSIQSSVCGIPSTAAAYSLNLTAVPAGPLGYLVAWPAGQAQPATSSLNSPDGSIVSGAAIVPAGANGAINIFASNTTDLIADINGYFVPHTSSSLQFYPLAPCRVADTRTGSGGLGSPSLIGTAVRTLPILSSACGAPATARAYSFNVTAVPHGTLGYLSLWPAGQSQPSTSTLNSIDGSVVANAAIVPAGTNGAVNVYSSNDSDLVIDINGYFAPPASGGLNLYTITPCRVVDTRSISSPLGGPALSAQTTRTFPISQSTCGLPSSAGAYALNVTVLPAGPLNYLTAWAAGSTQPSTSTLNAPKGIIVSNTAIVKSGVGGSVSVYVSNPSGVIIDSNGYFAQ